ncbi:uncharacterized protein AMSG_04550 [Thecamonas trahens ATCC 50062]|uniref:Uncharacterized protein n=1 Tax=Thecamonas trahens ATCC 50062 TaxID=461836 RepID=A0A0L0D7I7_THETB|nr:hypothetical protein AMSG_04550 [Thecamonas trahens ATCC 50062]KNC48319.1 hypothetical protein AMSG_04550 [Thecamonas trahens ATCC 50062]|eukprot:XP_013758886.1 hypothetical protein AMSG_04550 [Thecamonas trahens ATCC 50062]
MPWVWVCSEAECSGRRLGCAACIARGIHKGHDVEKLTDALDRHHKERVQVVEQVKKFAGQAAAAKELARTQRKVLAKVETTLTAKITKSFDRYVKKIIAHKAKALAELTAKVQTASMSLDTFESMLVNETNKLEAAAAQIEANTEQIGALILAKSNKLVKESKLALTKAAKATSLPPTSVTMSRRNARLPSVEVQLSATPASSLLSYTSALGISSITDTVAKVGPSTNGIVMSRGFKDVRHRFEFMLTPPSGAPDDAGCNVGVGVTSMATWDAQLRNSEQTIMWAMDKITSGKKEEKLSTTAKLAAGKVCAVEYDPHSGEFATFVEGASTGIHFQRVIRGDLLHFILSGDANWTLTCVSMTAVPSVSAAAAGSAFAAVGEAAMPAG